MGGERAYNPILLIDKPYGSTSFGVVAHVRRLVRGAKVGHAGTLDPMATGLLVLGVGEGTKKLSEYLKLPKTYEATIRLGVRTTTSDLEGVVLEAADASHIPEKAVRQAILGLIGTQELPVSVYSAIKQSGTPLYKRARRGENVEPPVRRMEVRNAEYVGVVYNNGYCDVRARFDVASGTYIRSLAEEVGKRLKMPATLAALRRTRVGDFRIEDARTLETVNIF